MKPTIQSNSAKWLSLVNQSFCKISFPPPATQGSSAEIFHTALHSGWFVSSQQKKD